MFRVVNVRDYPFEAPTPYIYVGRHMPKLFRGHPLANPFKVGRRAKRSTREAVLGQYRAWLDGLANLPEMLQRLWEQTAGGNLPLGCWCGTWPAQPGLLCHAVELARRLEALDQADARQLAELHAAERRVQMQEVMRQVREIEEKARGESNALRP